MIIFLTVQVFIFKLLNLGLTLICNKIYVEMCSNTFNMESSINYVASKLGFHYPLPTLILRNGYAQPLTPIPHIM
jgi:hypothetical protein